LNGDVLNVRFLVLMGRSRYHKHIHKSAVISDGLMMLGV